MDYLGYYFFFAVIVVLIVIGFECLRLWKGKQSKRDPLFEEHEGEVLTEPSQVRTFQKSASKFYSMTWHHIAPEVKKGHMIKVQGFLNPEMAYELLIEPKPDLSLKVVGCQVQGESMQHDPEHGCLVSLMPGMHSFLLKDEKDGANLVCGGSNGFKTEAFEKNKEVALVIENYVPKRQVSELRIHYKYAEPQFYFVHLDPVAPVVV